MPETKAAQRWAERLQRFDQAEMTVAQFCTSESVSQPSFYNWKKKLRGLATTDQPKQPALTASFVPVALPQTIGSVQVTVTTVELPGGIRVRVETPIDQSITANREDLS